MKQWRYYTGKEGGRQRGKENSNRNECPWLKRRDGSLITIRFIIYWVVEQISSATSSMKKSVTNASLVLATNCNWID